jgi:ATP phosphoribosyltransferase regulatory subunit
MTSAFNPLPRGARDLLSAARTRRNELVRILLERVDAWGYQTVSTPLIEYAETLGRGLDQSDRDRLVRFPEAGTGAIVALRSDVTPQIARLVALHSDEAELRDVIRLSYAADTVAIPRGDDDAIERHQVGVELIGDAGVHADAELIRLADDLLSAAGSSAHRFDLVPTAIVRRVLAAIPTALRGRARVLLARKDRDGLADLLADVTAGSTIASLADAFGEARPAIGRARRQLSALSVDRELDQLEAALDAIGEPTMSRVDIDLGEVRGHDYYTGLRIRVWAPGSSHPVLRGGRYDDMIGRYGPARPATGFAIDLDALEAALPVPPPDPRGRGTLVAVVGEAPTLRAAAEREAAQRRSGTAASAEIPARDLGRGRAWVERVAGVEHAQARALERGAASLLLMEAGATQEWTWRDGAWIGIEGTR